MGYAAAALVRRFVLLVNDVINRIFHPRWMMITLMVAWSVVWLCVGLRLQGVHFPWKTLTCLALITFAAAASSYAISCQQLGTRYAVVVADEITLRQGDGEQFAEITKINSSAGATYRMLTTRGGWVQVQMPSGQRGWLPRTAVEMI